MIWVICSLVALDDSVFTAVEHGGEIQIDLLLILVLLALLVVLILNLIEIIIELAGLFNFDVIFHFLTLLHILPGVFFQTVNGNV